MAKPDATIYITTITYNGITWNNTNGGPQGISLDYGGQNIPFRSGNDQFPVFNPIVDKELAITFELSEWKEEVKSGTKSSLAITIDKPDGTSMDPITYPNMRFVGASSNQPRAQYASRTLRFVYEADTGSTDPVVA